MDVTEVVVKVVRNVALQGTYGASEEELWKFSAEVLPQPLDDLLRSAVWSWIRTHPAIICTDAGVPLREEELKKPLTAHTGKKLRVYATEEEQWKALTGRPKEKNPVGPYPFELLCAVSRAREKGLTAVEIHKVTGQDSRSIFGRVQLLCSLGLVRRFPVLRDGSHTNLIIFHDYCDSNNLNFEIDSGTIDKTKLSQELVSLAKSKSNKLVLYSEAFRHLELDQHQKGVKYMGTLCRALEAKNCILRVSVHSPSNPNIQFKCVKYLKDLDGGVEEIDDDEEEGDDEIEVVKENIDLNDAVEVQGSNVRYNLFYPLEHQIYSYVRHHGTEGVSAMGIQRDVCGEGFVKPMSLLLPLLSVPEKAPNKDKYMALERGIDFIQRVKYYRYFTRISHRLFSKSHIPSPWGSIKELPQSHKTLRDLNRTTSVSLNGSCSILYDRNGRAIAAFQGEKAQGQLAMTSEDAPKKRGRPRKNATPTDAPLKLKKPRYTPAASSLPPIAQRKWVGGQNPPITGEPSLQFVPSTYAKDSGEAMVDDEDLAPKPVDNNTDGTSETSSGDAGASLAAQKRISAVKGILSKNEGIIEGGGALCRLMDDYLQEGKAIDRKTLRRVLNQLEDEGVIKQETLTTLSAKGVPVSRSLVYDANLDHSSKKYIEVREQILSRLSARRTLAATNPSLPSESITNEKVEKLFENVTEKPKRLRLLLSAAIRERSARRERDTRSTTESANINGPRASSLVNIPGRSDPNQFAKPENPALKRARAPTHTPFKPREIPIDDDLLFRAVVISRSLYSKNETSIDWDMVTGCIPGLKVRRARQKWINIRENFGGAKAVQRASYQWENLFIKYYQKGEITLQDPEKMSFDLRLYIEFWRKHFPGNILSQPLWRHNHSRLLSRKDYEQAYGAIKCKKQLNPLDSLPTLPSMVKADEQLTNTSFSFDPDTDENEVAGEEYSSEEKLVRKVIGMDDDKYDIAEAAARLEAIGEEHAKAALDRLIESKVVIFIPRDATQHIKPGRNYAFSERMMSALNFKHDTNVFTDAQKWVDQLAKDSMQRLQISIKDNEMVPLLELCAMGCIYLQRANIKTGRLIANYQSRHISRELLDFDIDIILKNQPSRLTAPPVPDGPLYVWGENKGTDIWNQIAKKALTVIHQKPGITTRHLSDYLKVGFDKSEIHEVIKWLCESGAVENRDGYRAMPQWYGVFAG